MKLENSNSQVPVTDDILIYSNPEFGAIRVTQKQGKMQFVGTDVAAALGYINLRDPIVNYVDSEDKSVVIRSTSSGEQTLIVITINGVYQLLSRSGKPRAKELSRWITDEVFPLLYQQRQDSAGSLSICQERETLGGLVQKELDAREERIRELQTENAEQKRQLREYELKARYYDQVLQSKELLTITQIAQDYGMTAQEMNKLLHEKGIQYKQGAVWLLYEEYASKGYTQSRTAPQNGEYVCTYTCWTQKGRVFLYQRLKEEGILPLSEQIEEDAPTGTLWH